MNEELLARSERDAWRTKAIELARRILLLTAESETWRESRRVAEEVLHNWREPIP